MKIHVPHQITDYATAFGVMTAFLVGSLMVCTALAMIQTALFH